MISIFKLDGGRIQKPFSLWNLIKTHIYFLYFNQEWVNETDPEVKALKRRIFELMDLNNLKELELGKVLILTMMQ